MHVEIWSDIACPWCYVGKRRFEAALAAFEHRDQVQVTWRSFELDPAAPAERPDSGAEHLAAKYGMSVEQATAMNRQMTGTAAGEGLDFRFDRQRGGNTFDAHRLVHFAAAHGRQDAMKERLMRAYFTEGELMSDRATLERLAAEVGLPADEVARRPRRRPLRRRRPRRRAHGRGAGHHRRPVLRRRPGVRRVGRPAARGARRPAPARLGGAAGRGRRRPARAAASTAAERGGRLRACAPAVASPPPPS